MAVVALIVIFQDFYDEVKWDVVCGITIRGRAIVHQTAPVVTGSTGVCPIRVFCTSRLWVVSPPRALVLLREL